MIVNKKTENNKVVPDLPQGWEVGVQFSGAKYNPETDNYTLTFTSEQLSNLRISAVQGKAELERRGLLSTVEAMVNSQTKAVQIYWQESTYWNTFDPLILTIAAAVGITDIQEFKASAETITPTIAP